jgi:hypothetical protein
MSPAHPFIKSRVADLRNVIDGELFAWLSGKKHPNIEYSGTLPLVFWGPFLNERVASITDTAFVAAREIAEKNGIDPIASAKAASNVAENEVRSLINKMIDYDRKMRGRGFPKSVPAKDVSSELKNSIDFILKRRTAEINILSESMKTRIELPLSSEHGLSWFFIHCHLQTKIAIIALTLSVWGSAVALGYSAGQNNFINRLISLFTTP